MHYQDDDDGRITQVEGSFAKDCQSLANDSCWPSLSGTDPSDIQLALRFKEIKLLKGNKPPDYDGEYRACVINDSMRGDWWRINQKKREGPFNFKPE